MYKSVSSKTFIQFNALKKFLDIILLKQLYIIIVCFIKSVFQYPKNCLGLVIMILNKSFNNLNNFIK